MNFPDETGKMSEGQKGGGTAEVQEKHAREKSKKGLRLKEKNLSFRLTWRADSDKKTPQTNINNLKDSIPIKAASLKD